MDKDELRPITDVSFLSKLENSDYLIWSMRSIAKLLYLEYGKYPILLIDEYDVPLKRVAYHDNLNKKIHESEKGFRADNHYKMETLMSGFFGILKDKKLQLKSLW